MASTRVLRCKCKHEFQDERYGRGLRLHNAKVDGKKYVCTVCRNERTKDSPF